MKGKKKILLVNFSLNWGGGEVQHLELAKEFISQGHDATLVVAPKGVLAQRANKQNIKTLFLDAGKFTFIAPSMIYKVKRLLKTEKPDAIILNSSLELKHFAIVTSHKHHNLIYRRGFHFLIKPSTLNKLLFRRLSHVVANSEFIKESALNEITKTCHTPTHVINNGIKPLTYIKEPQYHSNRILAMGRLVKYKQFDILIEAMPAILKNNPSAELWIVGEGEEHQRLVEIIKELKLENSVVLKGFCNNIEEIISDCALVVHPAKAEAFGVVFLEAMRQKLPCIAFSGHASDEIIKHQHTGLLVDSMDSKALSKSISRLLSSQADLKRFGENGYERFNSIFTIEQSANKFLHLI